MERLSLATALAAIVFSWALPGFAGDPSGAPSIVLKLNDTITDPAAIDYASLPQIEGRHAVVCPTTDALQFQLHNYLLHHDGKYWCLFSHGPVVEDVPTQFVSYATSDDGLTWTMPRR